MKKAQAKAGTVVTCKEREIAYATDGEGGVHKDVQCLFTPDDVGIVTYTTRQFAAITFRKFAGTWRALVDYTNLEPATLEQRQKNGIVSRSNA